MKLAFVGGTGPEGLGLAMRFARSGNDVAIGSRSADRGEEGAGKVREAVPGANATGGANADIVRDADVVFLTFPYSGQQPTLEALGPALDDKIVCNVVAPLEFVKGIGAVAMNVEGKSAAQEAAQQLPEARVVSGFQNLSAEELMELDHPIPADVLAVMDTAGVERAHVVGCSLGSRVARRLAALAPRRVRSLALLCPPNGINATPEDLKTAFFWDPAQPLVESARKAWTIVHPPAWAEAHDAELVADFERAQRNPTPGHTYHLQFAAGVTEDDLNAPLNEHDWRVLILQGDSDRLVPPANATALAAEVPRAQLEMLPGCSHNFWQHAPGEAASKLRAFLRTSDTAGGAA